MIRIQLVHEGRVVKQISSRLHEGIVLEQVKLYKDPVDAIIIVEGQLSEDARSILQHVAKKIVPAAMAAGIAMSGAGHAQAQGGANPHYPGLNHSVGQHMADIFNPNYKELVSRRNYERETQRREWVAQQEEIRRARVANARASGRQQTGQSASTNSVKVYDQANISSDRKAYILYDMENRIRKIPVNGTDFVPGDSQRLPHYITSSGNIYYVRHPAQGGVSENIIEDGLNDFFFTHLNKLNESWLHPIHFVGSVAYGFKDVLKQLADGYEIELGKIVKSPMDGLIEYHSKH